MMVTLPATTSGPGNTPGASTPTSDALTYFQTALALGYPEPAVLHEAIGDLHTLSGSYSQARGDYETAAALAAHDEVGRAIGPIGAQAGTITSPAGRVGAGRKSLPRGD